jgi:hypothetical protein
MPADTVPADAPSPSRTARAAALAGAFATCVGLLAHQIWREWPAERFALSLVLAALALTAAWALRRALRLSLATALAVAWGLALIVWVGPLPVLAAAMLGTAALAIGGALTPATLPARTAVATCVGLAIIAGIAGWTVTLPLHRLWLWWPLLLAIVALRRRALMLDLRATAQGWRAEVDGSPRAAAATVLLLGLASTGCWLPSLQMDDLTYHLGLPAHWLQHGRYAPAADVQIWSYAPWAGDVLHGIVVVLARTSTHGALNALWLLLIAASAWALATAAGASIRERWAAAALTAAFPPLVWMAAGQQTELAATALLLALMTAILGEGRGRLWIGAALFAGLCALKLAHAAAALPLLLYALWRHRGVAPGPLLLACTLWAALASSSLLHAWLATGNPLLPLFNDVFRSPAMPPIAFDDPRWHAGFAPDLLWRMTFDSDRYVEGWDGGLGFGLIALGGLWLLALVRRGQRLLFAAITLSLLAPLVPLQYARYAWPSIVLLLVLVPAGLEPRLGVRAFGWLIAGLCALNLAYQSNASWLHHSAALKRAIRSPFDDTPLLRAYLPERLLLRRLPADDTGLVLATDPARGFVAELGGRGRTASSHAPRWQAAARAADDDVTGVRWVQLLAREKIRWVLVNADTASPALRAGLRVASARELAREGAIALWSLPSAERTP